jgi:hypothetical protein
MIRLALLEQARDELERLLGASAPREEGAFLLLREGQGRQGTRLLAGDLLVPPADAWERQAKGALRPTARWLSAVISRAVDAKCGLLFVHSHPGAHHPAGFSRVDVDALTALGETIAPMLDGPFAAAVVHTETWAGLLWRDSQLHPIGPIVAVGKGMRILSAVPQERDEPALDSRQRDALGVVHDRLRPLSVGLVGCGGLGSPIAEQLVRMGVAELLLLDHDALDTESNVRRVFGSTAADLRATVPPPKVDVVGRHLESLGLTTQVRRINGDVRGEAAFRSLLDTDVVVMGTDTHGSRAVVNELASTYLLPVVDVGVRVGARKGGVLSGLVSELRLLAPARPCLWCRGAISADVIRAENLPEEERQRLQAEGYIVGVPTGPVPSVIALTVLGAAMATCSLIGLLSDDGDIVPSGYVFDGMLGDAFETHPTEPKPDCRCRTQLGLGDTSPPPFV